MTTEEIKAAAEGAKAAWDAGDFKTASRLRQELHEKLPERVVTQSHDGEILLDGKLVE